MGTVKGMRFGVVVEGADRFTVEVSALEEPASLLDVIRIGIAMEEALPENAHARGHVIESLVNKWLLDE